MKQFFLSCSQDNSFQKCAHKQFTTCQDWFGNMAFSKGVLLKVQLRLQVKPDRCMKNCANLIWNRSVVCNLHTCICPKVVIFKDAGIYGQHIPRHTHTWISCILMCMSVHHCVRVHISMHMNINSYTPVTIASGFEAKMYLHQFRYLSNICVRSNCVWHYRIFQGEMSSSVIYWIMFWSANGQNPISDSIKTSRTERSN